jgi:hypothetical protein
MVLKAGCRMVYNYITSNDTILGESQSGKDFQGSNCNIIEVLFGSFLGGTEKTSGRTAAIRSRYLLNTRTATPACYSTTLPVTKITGLLRITTFRSKTDRIYDGGPIIL